MKKFLTAVFCLISILGVQHLSAAGPEKESWKETKATDRSIATRKPTPPRRAMP